MYSYICTVRTVPTDINECETGNNLCNSNANCTDTEGSYDCACMTGYSGDGRNCESEFYFTIPPMDFVYDNALSEEVLFIDLYSTHLLCVFIPLLNSYFAHVPLQILMNV